MTGPEHYALAASLTAKAMDDPIASRAGALLAAAQVHATLAQTAATIEAARADLAREITPAWAEATR